MVGTATSSPQWGDMQDDGDPGSAATRPETNLPPVDRRFRTEDYGPATGRRIGRYEILSRLGRGGMGVVLEAFDQTLGRRIALKVLQRDLGEQHGERLLREAQALARLSHPNVVAVYEVGQFGGRTFIAMELVSGQTLLDWQEAPHSWTAIVDVYIQAGRGLAAAHAEGLVHRDFKPSNCIVDDKGRVRVLDFGLAGDVETLKRAAAAREGKPVEPEPEPDFDRSHSALARPITVEGTVMGTLPYMAPEQFAGSSTDAKSDQYSFCVALFEALYGYRPKARGRSKGGAELPHLPPKGRPPRRIPRAIQRILDRGLATEQDDRWPSMDALLQQLERYRRARWVRRGAVVLVVANLGVIGLVTQRDTSTPPCQGAQRRLDGVWDDARSQAVQSAMLGTAVAYAPDMWTATQSRLTHYAEAWVQMHSEACEATQVHGEQSEAVLDLRMQCLEQRRTALSQTVALLTEADAQVVEQAARVVADLPALSRCADVEALSAELPPPEDAAVMARIEPLRAELRRARMLRKSGKYEQSLSVVDPALTEAEELGHEPLVAEALRERGDLNHEAGRYEDAERDLRRAFTLALRSGHHDVAAEASVELTVVSGVLLGNAELGRWLGESAQALAQRRDPDGVMEARSLVRIGQLQDTHGEYEAAEGYFVRALELLERASESDPLEEVYALDGLRSALLGQARYDEALDRAQEALTLIEQELGPRHPAVVVQLAHLATVLVEQGDRSEAARKLRHALGVAQQALPPNHPTTAMVRSNLGATLLYQGKNKEAEVELDAALDIWQAVHDPEHDQVANARANLGVVLRKLGRNTEAEDSYRRALEAYREVYDDPHHPTIAVVRLNLGKVVAALERYDEASKLYEQARVSLEHKLGSGHPRVASVLDSIGGLRFKQERYEDAVVLHQRALGILEQTSSAESPNPGIARSAWALGRTLHRLGRLEQALGPLERALDIHRHHEARPASRARTELALARVRWDIGDELAAIELANAARERLDAAGDQASPLRNEVAEWLDEHSTEKVIPSRSRPL